MVNFFEIMAARRADVRPLILACEMEATMRPTTAFENVFDFDALLHPGKAFGHPRRCRGARLSIDR
jgi:hypothetical protein